MDSDELKRYFRTRINTVIRESQTPASERTEETFHQLRVEIKKIKALYELIKFCDKKFHREKSLKVFKDVFDTAGEVRNLQIQENTVADFGLTKSKSKIIYALHKKQHKAIKQFEKVIGKKLTKQIEKNGKHSEKLLLAIKEKEFDEYYQKSYSKIDKLISTRFRTEDLHQTRMDIKEFLYNVKLKLSSSNKLVTYLDQLQEQIGNWHDCIFITRFLDELVSDKKLTPSELRLLKTIRQKVLRKKNLLLPKINQDRLRLRKVLKPHLK